MERNPTETHVFYAPHADDETLHMGVLIRRSVESGHRVIVVLLTDGNASKVKDTLNGKLFCSWHNCYHDPVAEGFADAPITDNHFLMRRNIEFYDACRELGVHEAHLYSFGYPDQSLTVDVVKQTVLWMESRFPGAVHHSLTYSHQVERHPDHTTTGSALLELYDNKKIRDVVFYVSRTYWTELDACGMPGSFSTITASESEKAAVASAIDAFRNWHPQVGQYGIGSHSAEMKFRSFLNDGTIRIHKPHAAIG